MAEWTKIYTFEYYSNTKITIMSKGLSDKIEQARDYLESQGCSPEEIDRRLFNPDEYEDNDIDKFFDKITEKAEIEGIKNKIRNSLRAYIIGDALGVPFEFKTKGTFNCTDFVGGGTHGQTHLTLP